MTSVHFTDYPCLTYTWLNFIISLTSLHFTTPYQTDYVAIISDSDFFVFVYLHIRLIWLPERHLDWLDMTRSLISLYLTKDYTVWLTYVISDFITIDYLISHLTWIDWLWLHGYLTDLQFWSFAIWLWYMIWLYYISLLTYQTNLTSLD